MEDFNNFLWHCQLPFFLIDFMDIIYPKFYKYYVFILQRCKILQKQNL
jgi:hypothetical protein